MSAFIVSNETINFIIHYASLHIKGDTFIKFPTPIEEFEQVEGYVRIRFSDAFEAIQVGQIFIDENVRSVNYRYKDSNPPHAYIAQKRPSLYDQTKDIVSVIKQLDCLRYQSCELHDYESSFAFAILEYIRKHAVNKLLARNGYDEAPWGM